MPVQQRSIERILRTVRQIINSPDVKYYQIGITTKPALRKAADYDEKCLVVLADRLNAADAKDVEDRVQTEAKTNPQLNPKYHPRRVGLRHFPSDGGTKVPRSDPSWSVYIAWKYEI